MIQILLDNNENQSCAALARKAIEAGYEWLIMPDVATAEQENELKEVTGICREAGVILTIENNIEACRRYGLHGVFLHRGANAAAVRQELGAEAIIGIEIGTPSSAVTLSKADIDYFALVPADAHIIAEARKAGVETHFVAVNPPAGEIEALKELGFSGFMQKATETLC